MTVSYHLENTFEGVGFVVKLPVVGGVKDLGRDKGVESES